MPRPRSAAADTAILDAARRLFGEGGLGAVTVEAVARRAGVGKQTVYRRYADRNAVLAAAWLEVAEGEVVVPESADPERDLALFLKRLFGAFGANAEPLRSLMAQAQFEPELRQTLRAAFIDRRRATLADLLRRLAPGASQADVGAVVDMAFGAMWYRLLVGHDTPGPALARRLAKLASAALA